MKIIAGILALFIFLAFAAEVFAAGRGTVVSDRLHVRAKPDKDSRSVMILKKGADFSVKGSPGQGWIEIEKNGIRGFVRNRKTYIRLTGDPGRGKPAKQTEIRKDIANPGSEKRKIERKIRQREEEIQAFSRKEKVVLGDLDGIDRELSRARMKMASIKNDLARIEKEIQGNSREREKLKEAVRRNEKHVARRLVALYKLGHVGKMNVLASAETMYGMIKRQRALAHVLEEDERIIAVHTENLERLKEIEVRLAESRQKTEELKKEAVFQVRAVENSRKRRSVLLSEIRHKKSAGLAALTSLKESARILDQTIRDLERDRLPRKKQDRKAARDEEPMIGTAFTARKGRLPMPVKGRVVKFFGKSRDNELRIETFQSGIQVKADRGEPVQAVGAGQVLYSDWLKGYGNLIIIDHGHGYYSLYGHTEEVFKRKGEQVEDREVIATVGDTGSLSGPLLHFEIRHRGQPLDPMAWLARGR